jgi:hypothetical protein
MAEVRRFRTFPDRRPLVFTRGRYAERLSIGAEAG